jgi:hypothetical protein
MLFVYGTGGTSEDNAWALAKARFDAETFWYRGNGSVDVVADSDFDAKKDPDRNVVLYGHADMNRAWLTVLDKSPMTVRRNAVRIGEREVKGDSFACLFVRPRSGSKAAQVGVVAGTGLPGLRRTDWLPYFVSGVGYPDLLLLDTIGPSVAGFFGNDWSIETGEFSWRP